MFKSNSDADIGQRIHKTNKKWKKMNFFIKKSVYCPIFVLKHGYFL